MNVQSLFSTRAWRELESRSKNIPGLFWAHWEAHWLSHFTTLYSFLATKKNDGVDFSGNPKISAGLKNLKFYIIKQLWKDQTMMDPLIYDFIRQNMRNQIHVLFCLSESYRQEEKPISPEGVARLLRCLDETKVFWDRIRESAGQKL